MILDNTNEQFFDLSKEYDAAVVDNSITGEVNTQVNAYESHSAPFVKETLEASARDEYNGVQSTAEILEKEAVELNYSDIDAHEFQSDINSMEAETNKPGPKEDEEILNPINVIVSESTSFICFAGSFAHLLEMLEDSKKLLNELNDPNTVINEKSFVVQAMSFIKSIKEDCEKSMVLGENIVKKFEADETKFIYSESLEESHCLINHDPGLRDPIKSDSQRDYLISMGPHQPKLAIFPSDGKDRFNSNWYDEYKFLEYSTVKNKAFCFVCYLFPSGAGRSKSEANWYDNGVSNWGKMKSRGKDKLGKLPAHFSSNSHKAALQSYCSFLEKKNYIDMNLDKKRRQLELEEEKRLNYNRKIIEILFDLTNMMARQGLAFRGGAEDDTENSSNFYQFVKLIARHNALLNKWLTDKNLRPYKVTYLSPQSQNEFISILGKSVRAEIVKEIQNCEFYTVMADTTPDLSHKDILAVIIRICDEFGNPKERLLEVRETHDKTGLGMAKDIVDILQVNQLDVKSLSFQSYDFASSMSGEFKGAQKKVSEIVAHDVPYVPCQDHRVNTALEHCIKSSRIVSDLFDTLQELYVFFTSSPKRFKPLKEKLIKIENAISLRNLSKTRWVARAESLRAINESFEEIVELLEEICTSDSLDNITKSKASGLKKKLLNFDFISCMMFMKVIMFKLKILTETIESPELNVVDCKLIIESTISILQDINKDTYTLDNQIESAKCFAKKLAIDPDSNFKRHHRRRIQPKRYDDKNNEQTDFDFHKFYRKEFKCVLDTLIMRLKCNVNAVVDSIMPIFKIFSFPLSKSNLEISNVEAVISMMPPSAFRPDKYALQAELEILFGRCKTANNLNDVIEESKKLRSVLKTNFQIIKFIITAGFGVSSNERTFSQLKLIKPSLRTTMTNERLNDLMIIKCEKSLAESVDLTSAVNSWNQLKNRKIKTFIA